MPVEKEDTSWHEAQHLVLATCLAFRLEVESPNDVELLAGGREEGHHQVQLNLGFLYSFDQEADSGKLRLRHCYWLVLQNLPVWCANPAIFLWTTYSFIICDYVSLSDFQSAHMPRYLQTPFPQKATLLFCFVLS